MGKKKAVRNPEGADKTRFELRFDNDVFEQVKSLADRAQISVNQLMQGLARWAVGRLRVGEEPFREEDGFVKARPQVGCLWAGKPGQYRRMTPEEIQDEEDDRRGPLDEEELRVRDQKNMGDIWLSLDFTERRVVRDDGGT